MFSLIETYWPHILAVISLIIGLTAAIHATMTKQEVRTAIGWVGVIMLSPVLGAVIYAIFGINKINDRSVGKLRRDLKAIEHFQLAKYDVRPDRTTKCDQFSKAMTKLGDHISRCALTSGNEIELLNGGDEAYSVMLQAIDQAKKSILLETYIFDRDRVGQEFVERLQNAVKRGVSVRVLIDAVGARYSFPSIVHDLKNHNIPVAVFNGNIIIGLRLPYANLRTHRKILIIDGAIAFTGGMNIRESFSKKLKGKSALHDTHFKLKGPVVSDLFLIAAEDWRYTTNEELDSVEWTICQPSLMPGQGTEIRIIPSGPDKTIETNQRFLIGAFSVAQHHIRIMTPYFLPDRELISALVTAARRGVTVDIIVPANNNLKLVDRAMRAQFDQLLHDDCRIWRAAGAFDHSKLISIDNRWAYIGSSNIDTRSLRLNFELDLEIPDRQFAECISRRIEMSRQSAKLVELKDLKRRPFFLRLIDRVIWLGSPYL